MKQQGKRWGLSARIFLGLALGVAAGLAFQGAPGPLETVLRPVGTLFLNLLKMLVVPLVFSSIAVGACGLGNAGQVGRIGVKAVAFYLVTTALAVTLGLLFPGMTKPEMYALVQELARRFRAKNGSINCGQLLSGAGLPVDTSPNPEARTETYYKKRPCPDLVYDAAEIVEALCMEKGRI